MRIVFAVLLLAGIGAFAGSREGRPVPLVRRLRRRPRRRRHATAGFVTIEQCRATVSGVGGYCKPNPFYDGQPIVTPEAGPAQQAADVVTREPSMRDPRF